MIEGYTEFSAKNHECGSKIGGLVHCGPVGEEGPRSKVIPNIVVGVIHEAFEERVERTVCALDLSVALGVVGSSAGLV